MMVSFVSSAQTINDTFYDVKLGCSYVTAITTLSNKGVNYYAQNDKITIFEVDFCGFHFDGLTYEFNEKGCYQVRFIATSSDVISNMEQYASFVYMASEALGTPFADEENEYIYKDDKTVLVIKRFFDSEDLLYYFGLTFTLVSEYF